MSTASFTPVFKRELTAYFNSAIAYIFIIVFMMLNGGLFMAQFFLIGVADMRSFFNLLPYTLIVFLPAITMRLWAEDKRSNTLELLLTFPVPTRDLVIGKFLAAFVFYLVALASTYTLPIILNLLGSPDMGAIRAAYLGAILMGAFYLSLGIFISGFCRDQIVAFILAMVICFGFHMVGTEFIAATLDGWVSGMGNFLRYFFGTTHHYDSFTKGVIDNRDVLFFTVGTVLFLALNGFWLEARMRANASKIFSLALFLSIGIFFTSNWLLSDINLGRFDITDGKIFTVSESTKNILKKLDSPVTVKYYVSETEKMPTAMKTLEQDVVNKLEEFRIEGGDLFHYKVIHLDPSNMLVDENDGDQAEIPFEVEMAKKGLQPFQVQSIDADEMGVKLIYSSIGIGYKQKAEEILPQIMPQNVQQLEYMLISKIYRATLPEVPKIGLFAPYEERSMHPQMRAIMQQLGQTPPESYRMDDYEYMEAVLNYDGYEVERFDFNEHQPLPEDTKTLIVLEPTMLGKRQLYEINRFIHEGGSVFMAVQNYKYKYDPSGTEFRVEIELTNPKVNPLLEKWGLGINDDILLDEQMEYVNVNSGATVMFQQPMTVKLPTHILISSENMNKDISITSHLPDLFHLWGSAINLDEEKLKNLNLRHDRLMWSSPDAWTIPNPGYVLSSEDLEPSLAETRKSFPVAVMIQGQFPDAYAGENIPNWIEVEESQDEIDAENEVAEEKKSKEEAEELVPSPGKLILMGSSMMFQKSFAETGGHLDYFMNIIDALTLGDELISIRSKKPINRGIKRISSKQKLFYKSVGIFGIPIFIAILGAIRLLIRNRQKNQYMKTLS